MGGSRGRGTGGPPLKTHKNIGFLCNTGLDPLKSHEATKSTFNVGPSSVFCWRADDDPFIAVFGSSIPSSTNKIVIKFGPPLKKLLDPRMYYYHGSS